MNERRALRLAIVAGEESGDLLGADLAVALASMAGRRIELTGVGGRALRGQGLDSLFDADDIALMGIASVAKDLPRLVRRIGQTARAIVAARPDCLVTVDSPEFGLRVARKVRKADPSIPIIHYVCPSVWAWRPGRAAAMRPHVDDVLCLLPFEPAELERLGGPPGTFVGHRLTQDAGLAASAHAQLERAPASDDAPKTLLVLPGSRGGEVRALMAAFGETVALLAERAPGLRVALPTVPHVAGLVERASADWAVEPEIILETERKWRAFADADAALACSGTVALELALARVPFVSCYRTDPLARLAVPLITVWSASLPNLIADWPVVPEYFDRFIRPAYLARQIARLWSDTPVRAAQREGFADVARALQTPRPAGEMAAKAVLNRIRGQD